jgi:hypothetical protein
MTGFDKVNGPQRALTGRSSEILAMHPGDPVGLSLTGQLRSYVVTGTILHSGRSYCSGPVDLREICQPGR